MYRLVFKCLRRKTHLLGRVPRWPLAKPRPKLNWKSKKKRAVMTRGVKRLLQVLFNQTLFMKQPKELPNPLVFSEIEVTGRASISEGLLISIFYRSGRASRYSHQHWSSTSLDLGDSSLRKNKYCRVTPLLRSWKISGEFSRALSSWSSDCDDDYGRNFSGIDQFLEL